MGRLPVCPLPLQGEMLPSWVDQIARYYGLSRADTTGRIGLIDPDRRSASVQAFIQSLPHAVAAEVERRTGLAAKKARALTLARYLVGPQAVYHRRLWGMTDRSNVCPDCLKENGNRWMLAWRVTLLPVCQRHRRYLVGRCSCGQALHRSALGIGPSAVRCPSLNANAQRTGGVCGKAVADLIAAPVEDPVILGIQDRISEVFRDRTQVVNRERQIELMWAVTLVASYGTADLVDGADEAAVEAFERFRRQRDAGVFVEGRTSAVAEAREDCRVVAAIIRAAAGLVYATDLESEVERFCQIIQPNWESEIAKELRRFNFLLAHRVVRPFLQRGFTGVL